MGTGLTIQAITYQVRLTVELNPHHGSDGAANFVEKTVMPNCLQLKDNRVIPLAELSELSKRIKAPLNRAFTLVACKAARLSFAKFITTVEPAAMKCGISKRVAQAVP